LIHSPNSSKCSANITTKPSNNLTNNFASIKQLHEEKLEAFDFNTFFNQQTIKNNVPSHIHQQHQQQQQQQQQQHQSTSNQVNLIDKLIFVSILMLEYHL
jgi:hypothetical protein